MSFKAMVVGALFVASGCMNADPVSPLTDQPSFQLGPADGNGNKSVTAVDFVLPAFTTCPGGTTLDLHIVGWGQDRPGSDPPNKPGVVTFHYQFIYSNATGQTYVWTHTGLALFRFNENGDLIMYLAGRLGFDGIGRTVINLTTNELVVRAGKDVFADDLACEALT